jgi:hypothetical protein
MRGYAPSALVLFAASFAACGDSDPGMNPMPGPGVDAGAPDAEPPPDGSPPPDAAATGDPLPVRVRWARAWSDNGDGLSTFRFIDASATDTAGNLYLVGHFQGTLDFDPTSGVDDHTGVPTNPAGTTTGFVTKLLADGSYGWTRVLDCGVDAGRALGVATDPGGNVIVAGSFQAAQPVDFDFGPGHDDRTSGGPGSSDVFVTRISPQGDYQWTRTYGADGMESFAGVASSGLGVGADADGNVYVTGAFQRDVDFNFGTGLGQTDMLHVPKGETASFLTRINADGSYGWTHKLGAFSYGLTVDRQGKRIWIFGGDDGSHELDWTGGTDHAPGLAGMGATTFTSVGLDGAYQLSIYVDPTQGSVQGQQLGYAPQLAVGPDGALYAGGTYQRGVDFDWSAGVDRYATHTDSSEPIAHDPFGSLVRTPAGKYGWTTTEQSNKSSDSNPDSTLRNVAFGAGLLLRGGGFQGSFFPPISGSAVATTGSWMVAQRPDGAYLWATTAFAPIDYAGIAGHGGGAYLIGRFAQTPRLALPAEALQPGIAIVAIEPLACAPGDTLSCECLGGDPSKRSCAGGTFGPCQCPDPYAAKHLEDRRVCSRSCEDLGKNCGLVSDGCGGMQGCGTCLAPQVCGADSVCAAPTETTLASGRNHARALAASATHLYFADEGDYVLGPPNDGQSHGVVARVPIAGGAVETIATGGHPTSLALLGDHVYWGDRETGTLSGWPVAGGSIEAIGAGQIVTTDGTSLFFAGGQDLFRYDPAAAQVTLLHTGQPATAIAVDDQHVYALSATSLARFDKDGSNATSLINFGLTGADLLVLDGADLYLTTYEASGLQRLVRLPKSGPYGLFSNDVRDSDDPVTSLVAAPDALYLAIRGGFTATSWRGQILRVDRATNAQQALVSGVNHPAALWLGANGFFMTSTGSTHRHTDDGAVRRIW